MRKLIGVLAILIFLSAYIVAAVFIGEKLSGQHWAISVVYYTVAGIAWAFPLKPLLQWMHAKDEQLPSSDL